jgi:hypothetical protein
MPGQTNFLPQALQELVDQYRGGKPMFTGAAPMAPQMPELGKESPIDIPDGDMLTNMYGPAIPGNPPTPTAMPSPVPSAAPSLRPSPYEPERAKPGIRERLNPTREVSPVRPSHGDVKKEKYQGKPVPRPSHNLIKKMRGE